MDKKLRMERKEIFTNTDTLKKYFFRNMSNYRINQLNRKK